MLVAGNQLGKKGYLEGEDESILENSANKGISKCYK